MKLLALLLFQALLTPCLAQSSTTQPTMSAYAAQRENALAPAYAAQKNHDNEGAYKLFKQALEEYPNDARAMMLTAQAAQLAGHPEEAVSLYERIIADSNAALRKRTGTRLLPTLIQLYASLGRWTDFDKARATARQESLDGDPALPADNGYVIENYTDGARHIQVLEFPKPFGRYHTRYRFLTVSQFDPNTHFTPYVDLESDDIDQISFKQQHPDKAAAGDRAYSSTPTQNLVRRASSNSSTENPPTKKSEPSSSAPHPKTPKPPPL